jgi:glycosyltransferase involved in cell wall biosynthesis
MTRTADVDTGANASAEMPLVSIVIPAYNAVGEDQNKGAGSFLVQAVESALAQTYRNIEVIIVDDGSTDATAQVMQSRYGGDSRVRALHQPNRGPSAARNRGIAESRGAFLHFLDSDEFLHPTKVAQSYALFLRQSDIGVVYGHGIPLRAEDGAAIPMTYPPLPSGWVLCEWLSGTMSGGTYGVTSSVMVRREALERVGGFPEDQRVAEDWDLWIRLATRYQFAALNEKLVYYYRRADGLHANRLNMALGRLQTFQRVRDLAGREACLTDAQYTRMLASRWHVVAERYLESGQHQAARHAFGEAIRLHPTLSRVVFYLRSYF